MYYEKLALEVNANIAGLDIVKPPFVRGTSGVEHKFAFLASDRMNRYGFDIHNQVGEVEVLRSFIKRMDTGVEVFLVCLSGRPSPEGQRLASSYGMKVLNPAEAGDFFSNRIVQEIRSIKHAVTTK